jgi:hypothetical protein
MLVLFSATRTALGHEATPATVPISILIPG